MISISPRHRDVPHSYFAADSSEAPQRDIARRYRLQVSR